MNIAALRSLIARAHQHEAHTHHLRQSLERQQAPLHPAIEITETEPLQTLVEFVRAYIEQVPDMLEAAAGVAQLAGINTQLMPVLKVAEAFFLPAGASFDDSPSLLRLLDKAYLAHRLVEEINDLYIHHLGQTLIPLDLTTANLVAHQLIGEPFANQLDIAVDQAMQDLLAEDTFQQASVQHYRERLSRPHVVHAWKRWPCLSRNVGVSLSLQGTSPGQRSAGAGQLPASPLSRRVSRQ